MRRRELVVGCWLVAGLIACAVGSGWSKRGGRGGDFAPDAGAGASIDAHRSFAASVVVANLEVWPIVADAGTEFGQLGDFTTLREAQAAGFASIRELSDGADVNTLELENRGDRPLLVCAGTLLEGGQQDRQVGQDLVVAAHSTVALDAFCVEPERWSGSGETFEVQLCAAPAEVRASGQYDRDQSAVWSEVGRANSICCGRDMPETGTLLAALEGADEVTQQRREERERAILRRFERLRSEDVAVVGFAYAIDGEPVSVRTFAHPRLLDGHLAPFVKAMCVEAELAAASGDAEAGARRADLADVVSLVRETDGAPAELVERVESVESGASVNHVRRAGRSVSSRCFLPSLGFTGAITEDFTRRR